MKKVFIFVVVILLFTGGISLFFFDYIPYAIMLVVLSILSLRFIDWKEIKRPKEKKVFDKERLGEILDLMKRQ